MPKLTCKSVLFYSVGDELSFFKWIESIKFIRKFEGNGNNLYLSVKSKCPSDHCLRELLALFYRYKINMSQLSLFLNDKNKHWFFDNKEAYWHKKVFQK